MKKSLLTTAICLSMLVTSAFGQVEVTEIAISENDLNKNAPIIKSVSERVDSKGIYYSIELDSTFLIPTGVSGALGISALNSTVEAEVYATVYAIRLVSRENIHIPYGARVRVALNKNKTIYAEYEHELGVVDFGHRNGLIDQHRTISIQYKIGGKKSDILIGCGVGTNVHHPWSNETHGPEKGGNIRCRLQKRF